MNGPSSPHADDRSFGSRCACTAYNRIVFPLFRRVSGVNPLVVYYHVVSDRDVPHVAELYTFRDTARFRRDVDVFLRHYRPVSLQDLIAFLKGGPALPPHSLLLTFDDGFRECYSEVAPLLDQKGIPATFFLCSACTDNLELAYDLKKGLLAGRLRHNGTRPAQEREVRKILEGAGIPAHCLPGDLLLVDYQHRRILDEIAPVLGFDFTEYLKTVQPYLTSTQVARLLEKGHAVGAHSIDHPRYAEVSFDEQIRQTLESVWFVKERFGVGYGAFAFPSSDAGVSHGFFDSVVATGDVDVFFGNQGLLNDGATRNVQRCSMEKTWRPAGAVLGRSYARRLVRRAKGQLQIRRPSAPVPEASERARTSG